MSTPVSRETAGWGQSSSRSSSETGIDEKIMLIPLRTDI